MTKKIMLRFVPLAFSLLLPTVGANAICRYGGNIDDAWEDASVVASGIVTFLQVEKGGKYRLKIDNLYKGNLEKREIVFYDLHDASTATLALKSGDKYLVFLKKSDVRNMANQEGKPPSKDIVIAFRAIEMTGETTQKIKDAIVLYQDYKKITDPEKRKKYLLKCLKAPNHFVHEFFVLEILMNSIVEAVPFFEKQLASGSEANRLSAASNLRCLGYEKVREHVIQWINDTKWKNKTDAIDELAKWEMKKDIPLFRKFIHSDDDLLAVRARTVLLQFGEGDAKKLLFDTIASSTSQTARYCAIHALNWNYNGVFTTDEIGILKTLTGDKNESVSRVAGFIIEKLKARQKKTPPPTSSHSCHSLDLALANTVEISENHRELLDAVCHWNFPRLIMYPV